MTVRKSDDILQAFLRGLLFMSRTPLPPKTVMGPRDLLTLYLIIKKPGCSAADLRKWLNIRSQSSLQKAVHRLAEDGFTEDRRAAVRQAVPSEFHVTAKGLALWHEFEKALYDGQTN